MKKFFIIVIIVLFTFQFIIAKAQIQNFRTLYELISKPPDILRQELRKRGFTYDSKSLIKDSKMYTEIWYRYKTEDARKKGKVNESFVICLGTNTPYMYTYFNTSKPFAEDAISNLDGLGFTLQTNKKTDDGITQSYQNKKYFLSMQVHNQEGYSSQVYYIFEKVEDANFFQHAFK